MPGPDCSSVSSTLPGRRPIPALFVERVARVTSPSFSRLWSAEGLFSPGSSDGFPDRLRENWDFRTSTPDRSIFSQSRRADSRSEEHTTELQSRGQLVCGPRLEKKHPEAPQQRSP